MRPLLRPSALLVALLVLHVADHTLRQSRPTPSELGAVGSAGLLAAIAVLALAAARRAEAAQLAVVVGLSTALGFVAVHLLPHWGPFSDPYESAHLDALSWASMLGSIAAALLLAAAGIRALRADSRPAAGATLMP
jgi:hypothetical protein